VGETRKLAAILVSDVVGYSRLTGADEDRTLARLRALRSDLIDPTISVHHGRIVKRTGDGSVVEFRSVVDAVNCAIEVQRAMVERNAEVAPDKRIEFRIGVHLGDVVEESDGDLMGDGVNIASRLEGICEPGGVCLSEDAYRQVKGRLDLAVTDLGATQLKNIAEPIRVYSLQVGAPAVAKPATAAKASAPKKRSRLRLLSTGIAALLILVAAGAWYFFGANRPAPNASNASSPPKAAGLSIVVLPFVNLSRDPEHDYFADALTDGLTTDLARVPNSFVIARNTAFTYKGRPVDAKAIGNELGVRYLLEGSVQPSGDQIRVNAQLIDTDGGAHLWAEQFDTPRADLLLMQDEIVAHLVRSLEVQLVELKASRLERTPAANPNAEDLALQCQAALQKGGREAEAGYRLCEQALEADPNNVRALNGLSVKFLSQATGGNSADSKVGLKRADELVSQALGLDPNDGWAHANKALLLLIQGHPDEAIAENERALALDPIHASAYGALGLDYVLVGQFERSLEYTDKAIRLSPRDPDLALWYHQRGLAYFGLRQYDQAIEWARRSVAVNPNLSPFVHMQLIAALALTGHGAEAHEALQRYLALPSAGPKSIAALKALQAPFTYAQSDPRILELWDRRIEGLRKAGLPEE
jgi:adenylate cyclase